MKPTRLLATACVLALAACQHTAPRNPIATWVPSPNHDARRAQLIVVHYTEQDSVQRSLDTLQVLGSPHCGKGEPSQIIRVGHASPACVFSGVDVFGGEA